MWVPWVAGPDELFWSGSGIVTSTGNYGGGKAVCAW